MSIDFGGMQMRRLPIFLLLDTSGSMQGIKIVGVSNGVQQIYHELLNDPRSARTVYISVITFNDQAYQTPLVSVTSFSPPALIASGTTAMGAAFQILNESLDRDIIPNSFDRKGDYKPLVFLLTDGQPTDQWQYEAQRLATRTTNKVLNVIGLGIGDDADMNVIKQVSTAAFKMEHVTADSIRAYFQWVSNSIQTASQVAQTYRGGDPQLELGAPPPTVRLQL